MCDSTSKCIRSCQKMMLCKLLNSSFQCSLEQPWEYQNIIYLIWIVTTSSCNYICSSSFCFIRCDFWIWIRHSKYDWLRIHFLDISTINEIWLTKSQEYICSRYYCMNISLFLVEIIGSKFLFEFSHSLCSTSINCSLCINKHDMFHSSSNK